MRTHYYLLLLLASAGLASCSHIQPLARVKYTEEPFVKLKSTRGFDTAKANAEIVGTAGINNVAAASYGGVQNVALYSDGNYRWGNFKNEFIPLVSTGKLDVYQKITVSTYKESPASAPVSESKLYYYFNKSGNLNLQKANYTNLKPIVQSNAELKRKLTSFNITNKVTTVTEIGGFVATAVGLYMIYKAVSDVEGTATAPALTTPAIVSVGGLATYIVSHFVHRRNMRKIPEILLDYNRSQTGYRR